MTEKDDEKFFRATGCWLCSQFFTPLTCVVNIKGEVYGKFRDYCILTGNYTGSAHNGCKINATKPNFIAMILHNLNGCDRLVFLKELVARKNQKVQFRLFPKTKYIFISLG